MDSPTLRNLIKQTILAHHGPYQPPTIRSEVAFDEDEGHYLLMAIGWQGTQYVHSVILHLQEQGGLVWVNKNHTDSNILEELTEIGIPRAQIRIAQNSPEEAPTVILQAT